MTDSAMMRFSTLDEWLDWQLSINPEQIRLGLDRVGAAWTRMHPSPLPCKVITVAGTNGKGSSVAFLKEMLSASGYRVGCYTSPHLQRYNERILVDGKEATDAAICAAFEAIDQARETIPLTYFEFSTLAALVIFSQAELDVILLEVGLGGRLDAVNIIDSDVALITSVSLDHTHWLGETREAIGYEKAGIMRFGRPTVYAGKNVPESVLTHAETTGSRLYLAGRDFGFDVSDHGWEWWCADSRRRALPLPSMKGEYQLQNAAAAIMVLQQLKQALPVDQQGVKAGLVAARMPGRFELVAKAPEIILDVAHNPAAAEVLRANLKNMYCAGDSVAVFSMLEDKDIAQVVASVADVIDQWHIYPLTVARAAGIERLRQSLRQSGVDQGAIVVHPDCAHALAAAKTQAGREGRVVAFGSFHLVGDVKAVLDT